MAISDNPNVTPIDQARRAAAQRQREQIDQLKKMWWDTQAFKYFAEAVNENVDEKTAQRIVEMARDRDWFDAFALLWKEVAPYLEAQCEKDHDAEA